MHAGQIIYSDRIFLLQRVTRHVDHCLVKWMKQEKGTEFLSLKESPIHFNGLLLQYLILFPQQSHVKENRMSPRSRLVVKGEAITSSSSITFGDPQEFHN